MALSAAAARQAWLRRDEQAARGASQPSQRACGLSSTPTATVSGSEAAADAAECARPRARYLAVECSPVHGDGAELAAQTASRAARDASRPSGWQLAASGGQVSCGTPLGPLERGEAGQAEELAGWRQLRDAESTSPRHGPEWTVPSFPVVASAALTGRRRSGHFGTSFGSACCEDSCHTYGLASHVQVAEEQDTTMSVMEGQARSYASDAADPDGRSAGTTMGLGTAASWSKGDDHKGAGAWFDLF